MPTFKAVVRKTNKRKDEKYPVSIRVTHNRESVYIPTGLYVGKRQVTREFELKDQFVIERTNKTIRQYEEKLLDYDTEELRVMSVKAVAASLSKGNRKVSFSEYCGRLYKNDPVKYGALVYALGLAKQIGYESLMLSDVDRRFVTRFRMMIDEREIPASKRAGETKTKKLSSRVKNEYIMRLHQAYKMLVLELGDEASKYTKEDPFAGMKYYKPDAPKKGAIPVEDLRKFFAFESTKPRQNMIRDMVKLSFCLGGMNLGDILTMGKECFDGERLTYCRHKTKNARADNALTSIKVQPEIEDIVKKYQAAEGELLFDFGMVWERRTSRNFGMSVDRFCREAGLPPYNFYLFRHTVASIARNKFRYSRDDVGMLLNHRGAMTVDDVYIDDDFSINDEINRKILDYVFGKLDT